MSFPTTIPAWLKRRIPSLDWLAHYELYLTEVKGPVMDRLSGTDFLEQLGTEHVFLTTEEIYEELASPNLPHG